MDKDYLIVDFRCTFNDDVIVIYGPKLGSRYIDEALGKKNNYHVILKDSYPSPDGFLSITGVHQTLFGNPEEVEAQSLEAPRNEAISKEFLQNVFDGKSNKRDVIFIYRDPWEKYKSGIYQDFHPEYKREVFNQLTKEYLDFLILGKYSKIWETKKLHCYDKRGEIFTPHSKEVLSGYRALLNLTSLSKDRYQFFNMGKYSLRSLFDKYNLSVRERYPKDYEGPKSDFGVDAPRRVTHKHRKAFYDELETYSDRNIVDKKLEQAFINYEWFESHKRNFSNIYPNTIKK